MERLTFNFIPMDMGDCIVINLYENNGSYTILLDSGTSKDYKTKLRPYLSSLINRGKGIDLWILSHIHDDHIGGFVNYIKDLDLNIVPKTDNIVYNPPTTNYASFTSSGRNNTQSVYNPISISQSDIICEYLLKRNEAWIKAFCGKKIDFHGLEFFVLSPSIDSYATLLNNKKTRAKKKEDIYTPISVGNYDYNDTIERLSNKRFEEDNNIENGSSIALLIIYKGFRFLWMGDAYPSVVCESLKKLGYSEDKPLECEWATLAHHGSCHNTNTEWVRLVQAKDYIVTANGNNKYCLPNKESIARVLTSKARNINNKIQISFTKQGYALDNMFGNEQNAYQIYNFEMNVLPNYLSFDYQKL